MLPFTHVHSGFLFANTAWVRLRGLERCGPAKKSTAPETVGVKGKDPSGERGVGAFPPGLLIRVASGGDVCKPFYHGQNHACSIPLLSSLFSVPLPQLPNSPRQTPTTSSTLIFPACKISVANTYWVVCLIKAQNRCWLLVYVEKWKENERSGK